MNGEQKMCAKIADLERQLTEARGGHIEKKCRKCGGSVWTDSSDATILACNECLWRERDEELRQLERQRDELRAALEPFARANKFANPHVTVVNAHFTLAARVYDSTAPDAKGEQPEPIRAWLGFFNCPEHPHLHGRPNFETLRSSERATQLACNKYYDNWQERLPVKEIEIRVKGDGK